MEVLSRTIAKIKAPDIVPPRVIQDYSVARRAFWHIMKLNIKGDIILRDSDVHIIRNLILWLIKDPSCSWSLDKGILLCGSYGIGKSTIMKCASTYAYLHAAEDRVFNFARVNDILKAVDGFGKISEINKYTTGSWCLDDIGQMNEDVNLFGTKHNIVETLINDRVGKHIITHGTTNIKPHYFEEKYGRVVESRMHQMFNIIEMQGTTDHRKKQTP